MSEPVISDPDIVHDVRRSVVTLACGSAMVKSTFDRSITGVLVAIDDAREAAEPQRTADGDDDVAELLATVRLEMSVASARRDVEHAERLDQLAGALIAIAGAADAWLADPVIRARLAGMRPRDRAAAVECRVNAMADEMRLVAVEVGSCHGDPDAALRQARRSVQAARAALEVATLSVRHSH